jgi:hypothetical protein
MFNNNSNDDLKDPPVYDLLNVKFRGDTFNILLPYCEVANGQIMSIDNGEIVIYVQDDGKQEDVKMTHLEFVKVIEKTFDTKEIVKLSVQPAGSYEEIEIL